MSPADLDRVVGTAGPVVFWSLVLGAGFSSFAVDADTARMMRGIFAVFAAMFFAVAVCGMAAMLWAAVQ